MARDTFGLIGALVDGQLRIDAVIGEGGFSVVYKGEHLGLSEPVAIKCLKLPAQLDPALADAFAKRFRDESRLAYRLSQGNLHIVRSITSGTTVVPATGALLPYMALEWLEGRSLAREFATNRGKRMTVDEAVGMFEPAVQAMEYAHSQGIIHRDIKPGNLFIAQTREGLRLKVLDFGLAKILQAEGALGVAASVKTVANVLMCSPSYGAPEQFDASLGPIGPWTDVYAFALVFVEALVGQKARPADTLTQGAIRALDPNTLPTPRSLGVDVGDSIEQVLAHALTRDPAKRPASAGELWRLLREAMPVSGSGDIMAPTLREDMLPRMARVLTAPKEDDPTFLSAPAVALPLARPAAPADIPAVTIATASGRPALMTTMRMTDAPALPWELGRAMEQATLRKSAAPPPTMPNATADTMLAPNDPRYASAAGVASAATLPAGQVGTPLAPGPNVILPVRAASGSRVPVIVLVAVLVLFVLSALAFVAAVVFRARAH